MIVACLFYELCLFFRKMMVKFDKKRFACIIQAIKRGNYMAGPIVHKDFFSECIQKSNLNNNVDHSYKNNHNIYSQGHDLLLYIELLNFQRNRNVSLILSNYQFRDFILNYLKSAYNDKLLKDEHVRLFLYGYISHHILDSYFHPFIMQFSADYLPVWNKIWVHGMIETMFDSYFIQEHNNIKPEKYKLYRDFTWKNTENNGVASIIDQSVFNTYQISGVGRKFDISFHNIAKYMYIYRYDPLSLKKMLGQITNPIVRIGAQNFFYNEECLKDLQKYGNFENQPWMNIWSEKENKNIESFSSFWDVYNHALLNTVKIINVLEDMISCSEIDENTLKNFIPNNSAITGLECGKNLPFIKYKKRNNFQNQMGGFYGKVKE